MGKVTEIKNAGELETQFSGAGNKLVVIDFYATWCGPCKVIAPKIETMAKELGDSVIFLKVDVDECEDIAKDYEVTSMPTFKLVKGKRVVDEIVGVQEAKLKELVEKHK
ncbi:thioredoxin-2-like protein [Leptotrombidium deliense]|uniref:Thioredoxin n=1 Tax=Leptotrombidium deliense TaxID=299467 RepID=A0A443S9C7_9ACAR|nr:thioredoxin-2-like protein [Leptotrombidium deliense]